MFSLAPLILLSLITCSRKKRRLPPALRKEATLLDVLVELHKCEGLAWLLWQVCQGICERIEQDCMVRSFPEEPDDLVFSQKRSKNPADRKFALKQAWSARKKSLRHASKDAPNKSEKAAVLRAAAQRAKAWLSHRDLRNDRAKYLMASRAAFRGCKRLCIAVDASRGGGRKRSFYGMMCLETGATCWAPPQASSGRSLNCK